MNGYFLLITLVITISGCNIEVDEFEYRFAQQTLKKCPNQKEYLKSLIESDDKLSYLERGAFHTRCQEGQAHIAKNELIKDIEFVDEQLYLD